MKKQGHLRIQLDVSELILRAGSRPLAGFFAICQIVFGFETLFYVKCYNLSVLK